MHHFSTLVVFFFGFTTNRLSFWAIFDLQCETSSVFLNYIYLCRLERLEEPVVVPTGNGHLHDRASTVGVGTG